MHLLDTPAARRLLDLLEETSAALAVDRERGWTDGCGESVGLAESGRAVGDWATIRRTQPGGKGLRETMTITIDVPEEVVSTARLLTAERGEDFTAATVATAILDAYRSHRGTKAAAGGTTLRVREEVHNPVDRN